MQIRYTTLPSFLAVLSLASSAFAQQNEWLGDRGRWSLDRNWSSGVPKSTDHVVINQKTGRGQTQLARLDEISKVASLKVGSGSGKTGVLRIVREGLCIPLNPEDIGSESLSIGHDSGTGEVQLVSATLEVEGALRIGDGDGSTGTLEIESGTTLYCGMIQLGTLDGGVGTLIVDGPRSDLAGVALVVQNEDCELRFKTRRDISPIRTTVAPVLSGKLVIDAPRLRSDADEVLLIDNQSVDPIEGYFTDVAISGARDDFYELSYHGGDGNDLVLRVSDTPINTIEHWTTLHFPPDAQPEAIDFFADPDADGLSNIIEYKLGRSPLQPEAELGPTQTTDEETQITTTTATLFERVDRPDVRITPQAKLSGEHWQATPFVEAPTNFNEQYRRVEYRAITTGIPDTRLLAELMPNQEKLNVLFVISDDLSDWLGCMKGHPQAYTPNLDRLAERGVLFRQAHSCGTICGPSRVSLMTGVAPSVSGVYRNPQLLRDSPVLTNAWTMPSYFKSKDYYATGSGKVFHKPDPVSWNEYFPSLTSSKPPQYFPPNRPFISITNRGQQFDWGPLDEPIEVMSDYQVATWVGNRFHSLPQDNPFFMACGFFRPHLPFYAPRQFFDLFDPETIELPMVYEDDLDDLSAPAIDTINDLDHPEVLAAGEWKNAVHSYLASVAYMDAQAGRVLEQLEASGQARNTIVVFTSDHGFMMGEKGGWRKQNLWHRVTHVPLIIVAPGVSRPGTVCDAPASLLDIFPTLTDLCGLGSPSQLSGRSLVPQLIDPSRSGPPILSTRLRKQHSIHDGRFHYIRYPNGEQELYDLSIDPYEWFNLSQTPEAAAIMQDLSSYLPTTDAYPSPYPE